MFLLEHFAGWCEKVREPPTVFIAEYNKSKRQNYTDGGQPGDDDKRVWMCVPSEQLFTLVLFPRIFKV